MSYQLQSDQAGKIVREKEKSLNIKKPELATLVFLFLSMTEKNFLQIEPVLPSQNIQRDVEWHQKYTGFEFQFGDDLYAGIHREGMCIHLQWHADTNEDPLLGGSVIKIFVRDIQPVFEEFVKRGTIPPEKLQKNTPWGTHEFGFYDLNKNAIFVVQDV